jgi:predicted ATPase
MSNTAPTNGRTASDPPVPFIRRVKLRNYKSIEACDVELGPLTLLVGRNGAGKSNFLDALSFVADTLRSSLDYAVRARGGFREICSRRRGQDDTQGPVAIELEMTLRDRFLEERRVIFGFALAPDIQSGGVRFVNERFEVSGEGDEPEYGYVVENGKMAWVKPQQENSRRVLPDRPFLEYWLADEEAWNMYRGLYGFRVHDFNPELMGKPQRADAGEILLRDGANVASVLGRISSGAPERKERLLGYLSMIVPGLRDVERVELGPWETLRFRQAAHEPSSADLEFFASSMSDGTLRALGTLVAVAQSGDGPNPVRLVGIEEPETALHPAASGVLLDALDEATDRMQVVVTTHSADLLDRFDRLDEGTARLLVAEYRDGATVIGTINRASREAIREHLFSAGELLRMDQFEPDYDDLQRQRRSFEPAGRPE